MVGCVKRIVVLLYPATRIRHGEIKLNKEVHEARPHDGAASKPNYSWQWHVLRTHQGTSRLLMNVSPVRRN
jgi:hypothetical protein